MQDKELRFAVLKLVMEQGSEVDKRNPITKADELVKWVSATPVKRTSRTTKGGQG